MVLPWLVALLGALVGASVLARRSDARARGTRLTRLHRASAGEREARALLTAAGFDVLTEQASARVVLEVDGCPSSHGVRADYLVRRGSKRYVAEVKTGARAPSLEHAPTRRQLLEYRSAFDVDAVLLVDADAGTVREVTFATTPPRGVLRVFALGLVLGALLAWLGLTTLAP